MHSKLVLVSLGMLLLVCLLQNVDAAPKGKGNSPPKTPPKGKGAKGTPPAKKEQAKGKKTPPPSPKGTHEKKPNPAAVHPAPPKGGAHPASPHGKGPAPAPHSPPLPAAGAAHKDAKANGKDEAKVVQQSGHGKPQPPKTAGKAKVAAAVAGAGVAAPQQPQPHAAVQPAAPAQFLEPAQAAPTSFLASKPAPAAYQPVSEEQEQFESSLNYDNYSPKVLQSFDDKENLPAQHDFNAAEFETYPYYEKKLESNYPTSDGFIAALESHDDMDNLPVPAEVNNKVQKADFDDVD